MLQGQHAVIGLSEVNNGRKQRKLLKYGAAHELAKSNQLMRGHVGAEACLAVSP